LMIAFTSSSFAIEFVLSKVKIYFIINNTIILQ